MSKKILFTVTTDLNYDQRMMRICESLYNLGFDVTIVGRSLPHSAPLSTKPYKQRRLKCLFHKGKFFYLEYNIRLFFFVFFLRGYDIISSVDMDTLPGTFLATRFKKVKLYFDAHEYFSETIEVVRRPRIQKLWKKMERFFIPKTDFAYTVSESLAEAFKKHYHKDFSVIRNISVYNDSIQKKPGKPYLVYIGAVNEGRGLKEIIQAMHQIDSEFWICGYGDLYEELLAFTHEQNLASKVLFKGYVKPEELHQITKNASIGYLLLENKGKSYYYSLANKFYDYIHAEIPQITINFPEYQKINAQHEVAQLIDLDIAQIVQATNELLNNTTNYNRISANCKVAKKALCWQNEEKKLLELYSK